MNNKEYLQYLLNQNQILSSHNTILDLSHENKNRKLMDYNTEVLKSRNIKSTIIIKEFSKLMNVRWLYYFDHELGTYMYGIMNKKMIFPIFIPSYEKFEDYSVISPKILIRNLSLDIDSILNPSKFEYKNIRKQLINVFNDLREICDSLELEKKLFEII